jgi:hypothetical protein
MKKYALSEFSMIPSDGGVTDRETSIHTGEYVTEDHAYVNSPSGIRNCIQITH